MWDYCFQGQQPLRLHQTMFAMSIKAMGNDEQSKYWFDKLENFEIIGCYA